MPSRAAGKLSLPVHSPGSLLFLLPLAHTKKCLNLILLHHRKSSRSHHRGLRMHLFCFSPSYGASCANPAMTFTAYIANLPKSGAQILSRSRHHVLIRWMNTYTHTRLQASTFVSDARSPSNSNVTQNDDATIRRNGLAPSTAQDLHMLSSPRNFESMSTKQTLEGVETSLHTILG